MGGSVHWDLGISSIKDLEQRREKERAEKAVSVPVVPSNGKIPRELISRK